VVPKNPQQESSHQPSFEEALERLEEIVRLLEGGEIGLNEALARYEEGVKLLRQAFGLLEHAERRIELLSGVDAEGNPVCEPFSDEATVARHENPRHARGAQDTPQTD
jgi:exodeoxyribonuclease VII small subunit